MSSKYEYAKFLNVTHVIQNFVMHRRNDSYFNFKYLSVKKIASKS